MRELTMTRYEPNYPLPEWGHNRHDWKLQNSPGMLMTIAYKSKTKKKIFLKILKKKENH